MWKKKRVNLAIKDHVLRYAIGQGYSSNATTHLGEEPLPEGVIVDGKIEDPKALLDIVKSLVKREKWTNRTLYFCIPDSFITFREILVPLELERHEIRGYVELEWKDNHPFPFTDPIFDYAPLEEVDGKRRVLLVAYPNSIIHPYKEVFEQANLKPKVADVTAFSLYRLFAHLDKHKREESLLTIQWGFGSIVLAAFYGGIPAFIRSIKHTDDQSDGISSDTLLAIERFMDFYQFSIKEGSQQISRILLIAEDQNVTQIKERLQAQFSIPVDTFEADLQPVKQHFSDVLGLMTKA
ncbi:pilus assembly protein PilM [Radiobacillus kanasensis]|uniref:type IV pilus biogenesis protein PilM n=1 Tax=Radiobacillus kanasensis TaxID=2844358 RepID=UPI001E3E43EC|nr:pilus assembly protein PilM [Radiobacillus kanasensis]UFT97927.1 pilus assembly protein PilM [Radiobacillus kanasensis]